ncbi:MAG: outer membrane protein assembly factor BamC [Methylococcales bacterium]
MKQLKSSTLCLVLIAQTAVTSCGYIKTYFPDKEKDYQFTTEIPPLTLPDDLQENAKATAPKPAISAPSAAETANADQSNPAQETTTDSKAAEPVSNEPSSTEPPAKELKAISVELIKQDNDNRLRISAPLNRAWRIVDKALSRKAIEVTRRDQDGGLFVVQYDPKDRNLEDGSIWDEVKFMFSGFETDEKEFILMLTSNNEFTEVTVLDSDQKPATDMHSLSLLNLLHNTIKNDLAGTTE